MSSVALQIWEQIQKLPTAEQEELRDRLTDQHPYGVDDSTLEAEIIEASRRMALMLDEEENEAAKK